MFAKAKIKKMVGRYKIKYFIICLKRSNTIRLDQKGGVAYRNMAENEVNK